MSKKDRPVGLITGASSGLGVSFAGHLAASGFDLILVARRKKKLTSLAAELTKTYRIMVEVLPADLTTEAGKKTVEKRIRALDRLDILINNAGFGLAGEFVQQSIDKNLAMLSVHCEAPVRLAHIALPGMIARHTGSIINVASISAFTPMVGNVQYSATKSYLVTFSRALQLENRRHGIRIQALCPGFFHSEFHDVMRVNKTSIPAWLFMRADEVVRRSLAALKRNRVVYIPGFPYQMTVFLASLPGLGEWVVRVVTCLAGRRRREFIKARE
jgi:short-subunit dehydrogenase